MTHGSLFSGIGGFDLAAEWMGWENMFHCEWNPFGQRVLKHYWPNTTSYADITKTDFTIWRGRIDILTGGFPCQPYSTAGKRLGKEDKRHLWPEMLRAIREIQPRYVVGENVPGLLSWNGGMVFEEVQTDLEAQGYEVLPFLLPAAGVSAPHRRDRIWFVARRKNISYANSRSENPFRKDNGSYSGKEVKGTWAKYNSIVLNRNGRQRNVTHANGDQRSKRRMYSYESKKAERYFGPLNAFKNQRRDWEKFPTQPPICDGNDGLPTELDGIAFSKWRNESLKAGGNAIVPQVAHQIFKAIEQFETI